MIKSIKLSWLLLLSTILLACSASIENTSSNLTNSLNSNSSAAESEALTNFRCRGQLLSTSESERWRAQLQYIGETEKNIFIGGGVIFVEAANYSPKGDFTCSGQGRLTAESIQSSGQAYERTLIELTDLNFFANGAATENVEFKTAVIIGTSFKGTDEELQAFLNTVRK